MPDDPQRSHRRPRLADDSPAPIDALLDGVGDSEDRDDETSARSSADQLLRDQTAPPEPARRDERLIPSEPYPPDQPYEPDEAYLPDEIEVQAATSRGRPLAALLAAALLVALLVVAWARRRR